MIYCLSEKTQAEGYCAFQNDRGIDCSREWLLSLTRSFGCDLVVVIIQTVGEGVGWIVASVILYDMVEISSNVWWKWFGGGKFWNKRWVRDGFG